MSISNDRFYPTPVEETYAALVAAVPAIGRVKGQDAFSKSVTIATRSSGASWGSTLSAQVRPVEGGSVVILGGEAKVRVNITAKGAEHKKSIRLLDEVSRILQGAPAAERGGLMTPMRWLLLFVVLVVFCVLMAALTTD